MVPDVPASLELKIKRERYLAKQALADNQEALLVGRVSASSPGQCPGDAHTSLLTVGSHRVDLSPIGLWIDTQ